MCLSLGDPDYQRLTHWGIGSTNSAQNANDTVHQRSARTVTVGNASDNVTVTAGKSLWYHTGMQPRLDSKLARIAQEWPTSGVVTTAWLEARGISRQLARRYCQTGRLAQLGRGRFMRWGGCVTPLAVVAELLRDRPQAHIGAYSALECWDAAYYPHRNRGIVVFGPPQSRSPHWPAASTFGPDCELHYTRARLFRDDAGSGLATVQSESGFTLRISRVERALIELVELTPRYFPPEFTHEVFRNTHQVGTSLMGELLSACAKKGLAERVREIALKTRRPWAARLAVPMR